MLGSERARSARPAGTTTRGRHSGQVAGNGGATNLSGMAEIVVAADTSWVINDVRAALGDERFTIHEVADPRAVVAAVGEFAPAVVIVDLQIGSMGGMAITRAVRDAFAGGVETAPPVILLLDRDADAFLAGRSGAAGWVRKPFSSGDLRAAIDQLVPAP